MEITVYNQKGKEVEKLQVKAELFGVEFNEGLIHQALIRQLANARMATAQTKNRAAVAGGGRKPFRQKGTGRARQGTIRAPHYRGGGVVFGPTNERNYNLNMPQKQRRKAMLSALSSKFNDSAIIAIDKYEDTNAKTKAFAEMLKSLPINRDVLVVVDKDTKGLVNQVSRNLDNVKTILASYMNIADILKYDTILFTKAAVSELEQTFAS